jgi:hypothetical protein
MIRAIDIAIIGVQKAATSSLKNYLGQHPELLTHGEKEFTFFIRDEEYKEGYDKSFKNYFSKPDLAKKILIKNVGIIYWEEAIQRLYKHNRNAKIILMLRNPVSRAYSAYWYARSHGYENNLSFENAIARNVNEVTDKLRRGMIDYIERGNYFAQLNTLLKYFRKEQVKIILLEDFKDDSENLFRRVFEFCEIDPAFTPVIRKKINESSDARIPSLAQLVKQDSVVKQKLKIFIPDKTRVWMRMKIKKINRKEFVPPSLNSNIKQKLIEHYKPMVEKLSLILDRDLSNWNK